MPVDPKTGIWSPRVFPKQASLINCQRRFILASGPRACGKTIGVGHKIIQHMWHTPHARVFAVSKTIKAAKQGGTYTDLTQIILPEWFGAGLRGKTKDIKFEYTEEPHVDGSTRAHLFKLRNWFGNESEFYLYSLDHDDDVERKFKGKRASAFWFIELSNFGHRKVFDTTMLQLRMPHLKREAHLWVADTNPDPDGPDSWIYKLFIAKEGLDVFEDSDMVHSIEVFNFSIEDNVFADPGLISDLKASCRHSRDMWARMVEGRWVSYADKGLFVEQFRHDVHVVGSTLGAKEDWNVIAPDENCARLITGWDIGSHGNSSFHIIQPREVKLEDGGRTVVFDVIDELVTIGSKVTLDEFTAGAVELMNKWERFLGKKVQWRHLSDTSAFNFDTVVGAYQWMVVKAASEGRIDLEPCPKYAGSVMTRVRMMQQLLHDNRLYISAACVVTIDMLKNLQRGKSVAEPVRRDDHKHPFDSLTYALLPEDAGMVSQELSPRIETEARVIGVQY
jgi:hypothetical protein